MDESKTFLSRRRIIKGAGVATGIGIIGGGSLLYASQPALAAVGKDPITAEDLETTANDDSITEVTIKPSLSLKWSNFSNGVSEFDINVKAAPSGGNLSSAKTVQKVNKSNSSSKNNVSSYSVQDGGSETDESGIADIDLSGIDLVSSGAITTSDLPHNVGDGTKDTKTVDYAIEVTAKSNSGGGSATDTSPEGGGSFTVTLNNTAGSTNATGQINGSVTSGENTTSS